MALRTGSIGRELAREDPQLLEMILEDYKRSARRERSSRLDYAMGWLDAFRRKVSPEAQVSEGSSVPW